MKTEINTKICQRQRRGIDVTNPALRGTLPECLERAGIQPATPDAVAFTVMWYRGQMRAWAGWWRDSFGFALYRKDQEPEVAGRALFFAKMYRDSGRELAAKIQGGMA